jgi:hypothetical protein
MRKRCAPSSLRSLGTGAALALLLVARAALGQTVKGTVVAGDRPVSGVVVLLVDPSAKEVGRALTNERGEYRLTAPRPGSYRVRTMRIGFQSLSTPFFLIGADAEVERRLAVSEVAFALDTVRAVGRNQCKVIAADSSSVVAAVWDQVRNALLATRLSLGDRTILATTVGYMQMLEIVRRRVGEQQSNIRSDFLRQPWRSMPPEALHRSGYVATEAGDVRTYNAPGIDALLSDEFAGDHCLKIADKSDRERFGIAFEPTPDRGKIPEIRGQIWLDRATSELRSLEYRYVNVSKDEERDAGGEMSFVRMKNGMWAISTWKIRMPTMVLVPVYENMRVVGQDQRVDSIKVEGGELVAVVSAVAGRRDTLWSRPPMTLAGVVTDSVTSKPIRGAVVALAAARRVDTTDTDGRFAIGDMLPGNYQLEVRTPSLDSVAMAHTVPVAFTDGKATIRIRAPTAAQISGSICANAAKMTKRDGIIVGTVAVSGDSVPRAGIRVLARWNAVNMKGPITDMPPRGDEGWHTALPMATNEPRMTETGTDSAGVFRLCDVPTLTDLTIQAIVDSATQAYKRVRLSQVQRLGRVDFTIDPGKVVASSFTGTVVDTAGKPIADADVQLLDVGLQARTRANGAFSITGILPGSHPVQVRKVGYAVAETRVEFEAGKAADLRVVLMGITLLDSVMTTARPYRDPNMDEFEERRKIGIGRFVTRAEIAKREGAFLGSFLLQMPNVNIHSAQAGEWAIGRGPRCNKPGAAADIEKIKRANPPVDASELCDIYYVPSTFEARIGVPVGCFAKVYVDNQLMNPGTPTPPFNLRDVPPPQVEALEFYARPAEVPAKYNTLNSGCGVLIIHTRRPK